MKLIRSYSLKTVFVCILCFLLGLLGCSLLTTHVASAVDQMRREMQSISKENEELKQSLQHADAKKSDDFKGIKSQWEELKTKYHQLELANVKLKEEHSILKTEKEEESKSLVKLLNSEDKNKRSDTVPSCPTCAAAPAAAVCPVAGRTGKSEEYYDLPEYGDKVYIESSKRRKEFEEKLSNGRKSLSVHIISHTHWDREWYRTQEEFNRYAL